MNAAGVGKDRAFRRAFERLYGRLPTNEREYKDFTFALDLKIAFNAGRANMEKVKAELWRYPEAEDHYLEIVKAEHNKKSREQAQ